MFGMYPAIMVKKYILEKAKGELAEVTYKKHSQARRFPGPDVLGPGGEMYYSEAKVKEVLDYWAAWWKFGKGGTKRSTELLFTEMN